MKWRWWRFWVAAFVVYFGYFLLMRPPASPW